MATDFSKGKISSCIISQAIPLTLAQMVQLLYNVVDRIYIGHLHDVGKLALTGVGLTFPIITIIAAFTNLYGTGGTPLFSIARGARREKEAETILGNVLTLLVSTSVILFFFCYFFRRPILYLFGASDASYLYADQYLRIYLCGITFSMLGTGMNGFINAQGYPRIGMLTTMIGAVLNLILDPIFIFSLKMGVSGAALATVISQLVSALWVMKFLLGTKCPVRLQARNLKLDRTLDLRIIGLGTSGFIVQATNSLVQIVCNASLQKYGSQMYIGGGDLYVGIMTILNSVRELLTLPIHGITSGAQPVISFNYGARENRRVKEGIRFTAILGFSYTIAAWILVMIFPHFLIGLFSDDASMLAPGKEALYIYFFGFCFMAFQFIGQCTFQALGRAKRAIFFSLFRKVIIVTPLTLLLPMAGLGVHGVFWAEPISNVIGGLACFITMWRTVYRKL